LVNALLNLSANVASRIPRRQAIAGRFAPLGLLIVLLAVSGCALWAATVTYQTGAAVTYAAALSEAFDTARYAVGQEESLERKYRLEPAEKIRNHHQMAARAMITALLQARTISGPADRLLIDDVVAHHVQYLQAISHMFAAVDANDTAASTAIDEVEVDPRFDKIETQILALSDRHRIAAADKLEVLGAVQNRVLIATPLVFGLGVILVAFFWRAIHAYQCQIQEGLCREAATSRSGERRLSGLVQHASDMILICAVPGTITYQSPAAGTTWGYAPADLLGEPVGALTHLDDQPAFRELWNQLLETSSALTGGATRTTELRLRDAAGNWRDAQLIGTNLLQDPAVQGIVVTIRDITERKVFEQQLTQQAFFDALTGLPNRVLFRDRLEQALVRAGRRKDSVGLLFFDLDNFKLINDSLGHEVGDKLLIEAAGRLRGCVRAQDTVARLGGDEFVVVLELLTGEDDALPVARAIAEQFRRPFQLDGREVVVTASIGIAIAGAGLETADSLLRNADVAMYRAKGDGKAGYVVFEPSMHIDALTRLDLENDLRRAIDNHQLRVHYQPIVVMESGQVSEVEALVRWEHPTRGLMQPADFIPMAEETGLIIPLGKWVLEQGCLQLAEWHRQFPSAPPLTLSVNLSPRQFQKPFLVADVIQALLEAGLAANCLKLEITESVIMRDVEATIRTLWELKELGVRIAIDDFGTGHSSLSYLKRLPLDVLKIDRSFISGIVDDSEATAIVCAIMALAKSLDLKVTGEGIETAEQAALLSAWGCDQGQGYYFGKPLDGKKTGTLLGLAIGRANLLSEVAQV
jgi:diguanylate cyclase (GGDEF)-like protein/PAS domain S-box-containing protein